MELALIFVLEIAGLVLGLALARASIAAKPGATVGRVVAAVERAARTFLARARSRAVLLAALVAGSTLGAGLLLGRGEAAGAMAAGVGLGALLGVASALFSTVLGSRTLAAAVEGAGSRFDLALGAAVRGAGATGVVAQALGVLGALGAYGAELFVHRGQAVTPASNVLELGAQALPGYALGAALFALVADASAGAYASAARSGAHHATSLDSTLLRHDSKNPALIASLVGERLDHGATAARAFAATACATVGAFALALAPGGTTAPDLRLVTLPLLLWSFGLVANGAGLLVVRSLEAQGAAPALARGQASTAAVWLVGLMAGGYWLFAEAWPRLAAAGAVGLLGGALAPLAITRAFVRRQGPLRDALDGLRAGAATAQAGALGFGLGHAALSLLVVVGTALTSAHLGAASGAPGGERLGLLLALFAAMSTIPFAIAVASGAKLAESARGVAAMGGATPEAQARLQRVADSSQGPAAVASSQLWLAEGLGALAAVVGLSGAGAADAEVRGSMPWVALLGVALVLGVSGLAIRRSARGARELAHEVERQLATSPTEAPGEGRAPSYRSCEEAAARVGLSGSLRGILVAIGGPVLLGIALGLVYRGSGPRLAAEALATFVAGAAVTALGVALAVDGAHVVLASARRASRPEGEPATHAASVAGSALAELLGSAAGPAACTTALITASLALLLKTLIP